MKLNLISEKEEFVYQIGESNIYYHRVDAKRRQWVIRKHTKRGSTDWHAAMMEMIKGAITRWEKVVLEDKEVAFEPDLVDKIPDEHITELAELIGANTDQLESEAKNLKSTSDSNTKTKA